MDSKLPYMTKLHYDHTKYGEKSHGPSMTIPGESRTIAELMERYNKTGTAPFREGVYFDADDIEFINQYYNPFALDLTDIDALKAHVKRLQESIDTADRNKKAEQAEKKRIEQERQLREQQRQQAGQQTPADA